MVPEPRDRTTEVCVKWDNFIYEAAVLRPVADLGFIVSCSDCKYMFMVISGVASSKLSGKTKKTSLAFTRRTLTFSVR